MPYPNTISSSEWNTVSPALPSLLYSRKVWQLLVLRVVLVNRSKLQKCLNLHNVFVLDLHAEIPFCRKAAGRYCKVGALESWLAKWPQSDTYLCAFTQFRVQPLPYRTTHAESWSLELVYKIQNTDVLIHNEKCQPSREMAIHLAKMFSPCIKLYGN